MKVLYFIHGHIVIQYFMSFDVRQIILFYTIANTDVDLCLVFRNYC